MFRALGCNIYLKVIYLFERQIYINLKNVEDTVQRQMAKGKLVRQ